nr:NDP-hexose 2,3-dehydratase family protein [Streptomyces taklimakanensis]
MTGPRCPGTPPRSRSPASPPRPRPRPPAPCAPPGGGSRHRRLPRRPRRAVPASAAGGRFAAWWAERRRAARLTVTPIPFADLDQWGFAPAGGDLAHASGRFFTVTGLRRYDAGTAVHDQPIIAQPEIGVLGILVKRFGGVPHALMQAKAEPGNIGSVQLSPTVQATQSNYTRVHRGAATRHLEHFVGTARGRVLVDTLQSEQGAWFRHKRNRNMVVEATGDVTEHPNHHWVELEELRRLLRVDHLVNMDARSVLACAPFFRPPDTGDDPFLRALARSYRDPAVGRHGEQEVRTWLNDAKSRCAWNVRLLPLAEVGGWSRTAWELTDDAGRDFRIIAVRVTAGDREVANWSQPLLAPRGPGLAATAEGVLRAVSVRPPTVFGDCPTPTAVDRGVVTAMARRALAGEPLTVWRDGGIARDVLYVTDAARALVAALDHTDALAGRHWVVGTGRPTRLTDLFAAVAEVAAERTGRPPVPVVTVDPPAHATPPDFHSYTVDASAFREVTGWEPRVPLRTGLERAVRFLAGTDAGEPPARCRPGRGESAAR